MWRLNSQAGARGLRGGLKAYADKYGLERFHAGGQDGGSRGRRDELAFLEGPQEARSLASERERYKADYREAACLFYIKLSSSSITRE